MQIGATFFKCEISTLSLFSKEACAFEVLNKVNSPLNPSEPRARHNFAQFSKILFDRQYDDIYTDPGSPVLTKNKFGKNVVEIKKNYFELL